MTMNRRSFFRWLGGLAGGAVVAPFVGKAEADEPLEVADKPDFNGVTFTQDLRTKWDAIYIKNYDLNDGDDWTWHDPPEKPFCLPYRIVKDKATL